jgi:hypothetical protein
MADSDGFILGLASLSRISRDQQRLSVLVLFGVVEVQLLGQRNVVAVPPLPVAGLVAAQQQRGSARVEGEDDPDFGAASRSWA